MLRNVEHSRNNSKVCAISPRGDAVGFLLFVLDKKSFSMPSTFKDAQPDELGTKKGKLKNKKERSNQ